jgi:flagellar biosynthetic protein FliP
MDTASTGRPGPAGRFLLNFLELQIPMVLGAVVCFLLGRLIPDGSSLEAAYQPGTYLFAMGDVLFLSVPVVAWMRLRGAGWRLSIELAIAMIGPVAVVAVVGELAGYAYLLWLLTGMYPVMSLGLIVYMLYRRDRFIHRFDDAGRARDRLAARSATGTTTRRLVVAEGNASRPHLARDTPLRGLRHLLALRSGEARGKWSHRPASPKADHRGRPQLDHDARSGDSV